MSKSLSESVTMMSNVTTEVSVSSARLLDIYDSTTRLKMFDALMPSSMLARAVLSASSSSDVTYGRSRD